jgi:DNA-binding MarR family transcriptional regulator
MSNLDPLISQPSRLQIMASLMALAVEEQVDFRHLRDLLKLTDGNLGAHLQKLEDAGYIRMEKTFVAKKPRTYVSVTDKGRSAFREHVVALEQIIQSSKRESINE